MHCNWELKKNIFFIEFLSPLSFKKYFLFLFLSPPSLISSFFLLIFFLSLIYSLLRRSILDLHHRRSSLSSPMLPSHAANPSRLVLHLTAHPMLTSLVLHLTADPSSIANLSFIVNPSSTGIAFIELKSAADFVAVARFRGFLWVSWWRFSWVSWWLSFVGQW